jgi:hypothetical protein
MTLPSFCPPGNPIDATWLTRRDRNGDVEKFR